MILVSAMLQPASWLVFPAATLAVAPVRLAAVLSDGSSKVAAALQVDVV